MKTTTMTEIFSELDSMNLDLNYSDQKIDTSLNIHELDALIDSMTEKYGQNDEAVQYYIEKRKELLNQIIENISEKL
jgi:signal recognition particle GTPase